MQTYSKSVVEWKGHPYLIAFPSWGWICQNLSEWRSRCDRLSQQAQRYLKTEFEEFDAVLEIVAGSGISIIDMRSALKSHPAPLELYNYPGSHPTAKGYRFIVETVEGYLARDAVPSTVP